jgi:hypothetical protein
MLVMDDATRGADSELASVPAIDDETVLLVSATDEADAVEELAVVVAGLLNVSLVDDDASAVLVGTNEVIAGEEPNAAVNGELVELAGALATDDDAALLVSATGVVAVSAITVVAVTAIEELASTVDEVASGSLLAIDDVAVLV